MSSPDFSPLSVPVSSTNISIPYYHTNSSWCFTNIIIYHFHRSPDLRIRVRTPRRGIKRLRNILTLSHPPRLSRAVCATGTLTNTLANTSPTLLGNTALPAGSSRHLVRSGLFGKRYGWEKRVRSVPYLTDEGLKPVEERK